MKIDRRDFIKSCSLALPICLFQKEEGIADISFSALELEELIKKDYNREFNNKDKHIIKDINLRDFLREKITENNNSYLFGKYMDDIVSEFKIHFNGLYSQIKSSCYEPLQSWNLNYSLVIPNNFLVDEMGLSIEIDKKKSLLKVYQRFNSKNILLLEKPVGLGMGKTKERDFSTPSGIFYIKRLVKNPWWYPPEWASAKGPIGPGKNNPFGIWMAELYSNPNLIGYEFRLAGDDGIRLHSTNKPLGPSHGCVRGIPDVIEELYPAFLHYILHKEPKTTSRGTIYPLEKVIEVKIG
ncbi:MAG: L,D-transpeptidase [Candidatus Nanoarchaeia archaeon]